MPAARAAIPGAAVVKTATAAARRMHHDGALADSQRCASSVCSMIAYRMAAAAAALPPTAIENRTSAFMPSVAATRHLPPEIRDFRAPRTVGCASKQL